MTRASTRSGGRRPKSPELRSLDTITLGDNARPNHVEFVENIRGKAVYVSLARVDDGAPGNAGSSRIAMIDRSGAAGSRKVVGQFFSMGREAHGLWTNPEGTRLYIAHEQDELPNTPNAGQTVCTAFDVSDPFKPQFITQIALGEMALPSGKLRQRSEVFAGPRCRSRGSVCSKWQRSTSLFELLTSLIPSAVQSPVVNLRSRSLMISHMITLRSLTCLQALPLVTHESASGIFIQPC